MKKKICKSVISFLLVALMVVLFGCTTNEITIEDLVGTWEREGYPYASIAITDDGNLFVILETTIEGCTGWYEDRLRFRYEIVENQFVLTFVEEGSFGSLDEEGVEINIYDNHILLELEASDWFHPQSFVFTLYRVSDTNPEIEIEGNRHNYGCDDV